MLHDGWSVGELPAITGLDADAVERHLLDAAVKLGTRNANDTLDARGRARASGLRAAAMFFLFFGYGSKVKLRGAIAERTCPRCHNTARWHRLER